MFGHPALHNHNDPSAWLIATDDRPSKPGPGGTVSGAGPPKALDHTYTIRPATSSPTTVSPASSYVKQSIPIDAVEPPCPTELGGPSGSDHDSVAPSSTYSSPIRPQNTRVGFENPVISVEVSATGSNLNTFAGVEPTGPVM